MSGPSAPGVAVVHDRAAGRIRSGHPWVFSGDVIRAEGAHGDVVRVTDRRGHPLGFAFYSETSKISLRLVRREDVPPDDAFWASRVEQALARRGGLADPAGAYRAIFGESDGFPGLVVDVYAGHAVLQALTAGAERIVPAVLDAMAQRIEVSSVLARNDPASRTLEGLPREVKALRGVPPRLVEVREGPIAYLADPWHGQKTGAFLDQRTNRIRLGELARGTVLDVFSYHGSFAMHAATRAERVVAIDSSADALRRARENAALNGFRTVEFVLGNAFDELRARAAAREEWDVVILDPPAFAKGRSAAESARRGYKEINVRAMRLVAPGGILLTCTCSFHMPESGFYDLLAECAADAGRVFRVAERRGAGPDHPERLGFPESRYLKCAVLVREELS